MLILAFPVTLAADGAPQLRSIDGNATKSDRAPIEIRLGATSMAMGLPEAFRETRRALPAMRRSESRRFLMLSDLSDDEAAAHLQLLERSAHAVEALRSQLGLSATTPRPQRKMLAVAFGRRADFLWFAQRHDRINADWMAGYFAPEPGRLVYFHARDIPSARVAARRLEQMEGVAEALDSLESFISRSTASVVVHEAVHMILHEEGLMPANSGVPLWLAEGLAASFEPAEASQAFGPLRRENGRTRAFREDLAGDRVPPLRVLVASMTLPAGDEDAVRRFYDASAALCSWLVRTRPEALARMITASRGGNAGHDRAARIEAFELLVGSIDEVENAWLNEGR
jgi:hypothetical protein